MNDDRVLHKQESRDGVKPSFMTDYLAGTAPLKRAGHLRVLQHKVILDVSAYYGWVYLRRFWTPITGSGAGTACLKWLTVLAHAHKTIIMGHASKFSDVDVPRPSVLKLRTWYKKHGARFDRTGAFTIGEEEE